jgi:hypothetical protein
LGETFLVDGWAKIPFFNFQTCSLFWRSINRCMDFAYYVLGNRTSTRAKAVPRSLMDQTPEDLRTSTKRKMRTPSRSSSSRPVRLTLDLSEAAGAAPKEDIADSDDDLDTRAMAFPTVPPNTDQEFTESLPLTSSMVPPAYDGGDKLYSGQLSAPFLTNQEPGRPIPTNLSSGNSACPNNLSNPPSSVTPLSNHAALLDLLRASKAEKDKTTCRMTDAQHNVFHIISNGKSVLGAPYQNPSVFFAALRSYSRDMGVLFYPTKCKGIFAFEFGESVFIEEFQYSDWQAIAAQSKLVDMNDFSNKAKRPELPVLSSVGDLVACLDNFLHLAERIFKVEVIEEVRRIATFLRRNQSNISSHGVNIVAPLTLWTNQLLFKLRVAFESGSAEQLHEFRVAIHVNATEFSSVIQGALIATVRRLESRHYPDNSPSQGLRGMRRGTSKRKADGPDFNVVRVGIPAHNGKKVCYHHLSAKGCPGGPEHCKRPNFCHFIPKKTALSAETLAALKHHFGPLRQELQ